MIAELYAEENGLIMKLHNNTLALLLLLGCAYAKEQPNYDLHMTVVVSNPGSDGCNMSLSNDVVIYNISSNGFCTTFNTGAHVDARVYDSKWGIKIMEIKYYHKGKLKTAKYKVDSQIMR